MTSLWLESVLLPGGWARHVRVTAREGRIVSVTAESVPQADDERHAIGLPGLPNVHSHAFQRGLAGLTERRGPDTDTFWSWRELMYRFLDRLGPEELEAITALCFAEMLEAGFTHVGEFHYLHHDCRGMPFAEPGELAGRVAAAASLTGVGLTLLPVFYAHGNFGGAPPAPGQRRFITDIDSFATLLESCRRAVRGLAGASVGVAPHSLRAVTPAELAALLPLAGAGVVHIHVAEQLREVEQCRAWSGLAPVEWLLAHQPVDARWCLVHATQASAAELAGVAERAAVVGLCPLTEASLGDGVFAARSFLGWLGRFGVGTDSNITIDAAGELCALEYSQRLTARLRNVLAPGPGASTGRSLFAAALAGGAQAVRAPAGLQVGASLDLVTLAAGHPSLLERRDDELLDSWIFAGGRALVDCVWRAGSKVVSGGRHRERAAIVARYARALRTLRG